MCLIAVKNQNKELPKKEYLYNGYINNPNGVGIALLKANRTLGYIKKDFKDFGSFYNWIITNVNKEDMLIIHFRLATSGKTDEGNRHPFPITKNKILLRKLELYCRFIVAHNGVISEYNGNKKYSDTQKFIIDILANVKNKLGSKTILKLIANYIGGDRLAILDSIAQKIIMVGEFKEDEGIFYSNSGYKYSKEYKGISSYSPLSKWIDEDEEDYCELCGSKKKIRYDDYVQLLVCKKCQKKLKKDPDYLHFGRNCRVEYLNCDGCNSIYPITKLTQIEREYYLCEKCKKEFNYD
jgi:ribosomal protein L37AE/L43A